MIPSPRRLRRMLIGTLFLAGVGAVHAETEVSVPIGVRDDALRWSIADPDNQPNIISELSWDDVRSNTIGVRLAARSDLLNVRAAFARGRIYAGDNQDSDYGANDRGCEFSRSNNDAGSGDVSDLSVSVGYEFPQLTWARSQLVPYFGYSQYQLDLTMTDGQQTLSNPLCVPEELSDQGFVPFPVGPIPGLDSTYSAQWSGVHAAVEWRVQLASAWKAHLNYTRHWVDYQAQANWNLREDFAHPVSFEQSADGSGNAVVIGIEYELRPRLRIGAVLVQRDYRTGRGTAVFFGDDGGTDAAPLNPVTWESRAYGVTLTGEF